MLSLAHIPAAQSLASAHNTADLGSQQQPCARRDHSAAQSTSAAQRAAQLTNPKARHIPNPTHPHLIHNSGTPILCYIPSVLPHSTYVPTVDFHPLNANHTFTRVRVCVCAPRSLHSAGWSLLSTNPGYLGVCDATSILQSHNMLGRSVFDWLRLRPLLCCTPHATVDEERGVFSSICREQCCQSEWKKIVRFKMNRNIIK